jgi:RNA polymerase sigma factor (sigma-70 family)
MNAPGSSVDGKPDGAPGAPSGTHWSLVRAAGDPVSARHGEALEHVGRRYWQALYAFARRQGRSPEDASDLTQGFLERFLKPNGIASADPARGRFRTFLLASFKNYLANVRDRQRAIRRGGDREMLSLDVDSAESRYAFEAPDSATPDRVFERQWALALLERALLAVRREYGAAGKTALHDELRGLLWEEAGRESYGELGARIGMTEPAVKMAVVRLRRRCRQALLEEIARTVRDPEEVEDEYRHVVAVLRR